MDKLRQTLLNAIEIKGVNRTEIAKSVGLKSSSRVTEFLNNGEEMAFDIVLKIVRSLNPSKEFDLMEIYIEEVSTPKNIKMAMEYSSAHRLLNSLEYLIGLTKTEQLQIWTNGQRYILYFIHGKRYPMKALIVSISKFASVELQKMN